mgnify:CR=1 FL=1
MGVVYSCELLDEIVDAVQMEKMKVAKSESEKDCTDATAVKKVVYRKGELAKQQLKSWKTFGKPLFVF